MKTFLICLGYLLFLFVFTLLFTYVKSKKWIIFLAVLFFSILFSPIIFSILPDNMFDNLFSTSEVKEERANNNNNTLTSSIDVQEDSAEDEDYAIEETDDSNSESEDTSEDEVIEGLLYQGMYTRSGQGRFVESGQYTSPGGEMYLEITIYEDSLILLGYNFEFKGYEGRNRIYRGYSGQFDTKYVVSPSYDIYELTDVGNMGLGPAWVLTEFAKGECTMPKHYQSQMNSSDYSGEGYNHGSYSKHQSPSTHIETNRRDNRVACSSCKDTNGKCPVCKGTRRQTYSPYGYEGTRECTNCGGNGRCPVCGGDGWID